jgi:hypothetical protein
LREQTRDPRQRLGKVRREPGTLGASCGQCRA